MLIFIQSHQAVWNFDDVSRINVNGSGTGIVLTTRNGNGGELGKYRNREVCTYVMEMLVSAIEDGEPSFTFPTEESLEHARQHGSKVTNRKVSHGGS